jgi:DNA-binding Lrp family transcriptional regulator
MGLRAYVLIQAEPRRAGEVSREAQRVPGVVSCEVLAGPHDAIALVEMASLEELGRAVVSRLQLIEGVTRTLTCPVVELAP